MDEYLIISCIFGNIYKNIYSAPNNNCFFFTNNNKIKETIVNKGWNYVFVDFPIENFKLSSIQSKYIKFLIFLKDYPQFNKFNKIIYFDHKINLTSNWLNKSIDLSKKYSNYSVIIRKTPKLKTKIWHEVTAAKGQPRYADTMNNTIDFIHNMIKTKNIKANIRICRTGLLIYNDYTNIQPMLNQIYDSCVKLNQPECQIFWALFSQKYLSHIMTIENKILNPTWVCP